MYDIKKKQYIVKLSSGRILNYFTDERLGFMYGILGKRNIWSDPVPAIRDCTGRAALEVDGDDRIHVLYQTRQGNIFYSINTNNSWINHPVLNSKNPGVYEKNLQLRLVGQDTHFFYTLHHKDNTILGHQSIMNKSQLTPPEVIDYVPDFEIPYAVHDDQQGNLYVYYASSDGKYRQLGCKILSKNTSKWSEFKPITSFKGDHESPRVITDHSGNVHLVYSRRAGSGFELIYRSRTGAQNLWSTEKTVAASGEPYTTASLICIKEEIILFWLRDGAIFYSTLPANTLPSVIKTDRYPFGDPRQVSCVVYKTNLMGELMHFKVNEVPGHFVNGFRLAFINDHLTQDLNSFTPDELRGMIVDGLKMLTTQVSSLKENQQKLESSYFTINNTMQSLQRDFTKSSLRLEMLEKEIRSLKHSYLIKEEKPVETPQPENFLPDNEVTPVGRPEQQVKISEPQIDAEPVKAKELHAVKGSILTTEPLVAKEILLSDEPVMAFEPIVESKIVTETKIVAESKRDNTEPPSCENTFETQEKPSDIEGFSYIEPKIIEKLKMDHEKPDIFEKTEIDIKRFETGKKPVIDKTL